MNAPRVLLLLLGAAVACAGNSERIAREPRVASPRPSASARPRTAPPATLATPSYRECGALNCKAFATTEAAFDQVLADSPRVLAIGEAHAQRALSALPSTTRRFMDSLLPRLAPRATDLVIELWTANGSCGKVERQVEKQQQAVTAPQASTNQNEFLELGHRAKALQIQPHALVPNCEEYARVAGAGAGDIEQMLTLLKEVTQRDIQKLLGLREPQRLIVAYGGAMHNDLTPRLGREGFSFGPELARATSDSYVELDLILPEQIGDSEAWQGLPWYSHYDRAGSGTEAFLYSWAPRAYALIFPRT